MLVLMAFELHDPEKLLRSLCDLTSESNWAEFKENVFNAEAAGKYVAALANSAMLEKEKAAFMVWGVRDRTHEIVGTSVSLASETVGSEAFLLWLNKLLRPRLNVQHHAVSSLWVEIEGSSIEDCSSIESPDAIVKPSPVLNAFA